MPTLATTVDGLNLPNPFVIASGPPGTNLSVISHAFREGWGAVIAKTVSLDASKVINVAPRYAKLLANDPKDVVGWENIELISDRKFEIWLDEFKRCKDMSYFHYGPEVLITTCRRLEEAQEILTRQIHQSGRAAAPDSSEPCQ